MILGLGISFMGLLAILAGATAFGTFVIERAHPPRGRFVDVAGARLHIVELGPDGGGITGEPPIVLVHGASANLETLRPLAEAMAVRRRVILVDRPGHGWSAREKWSDSTPAIQARMIDEALGKIGVTRAIIVAHSWAGALGAAMAIHHRARVAGLVLLAPVTHPWPGGIAWYNNLATMPVIGRLFAWTIAQPIGLLMLEPGARSVFAPQIMRDNYGSESGLALLLRPSEFLANAWDMKTLKASVVAQMKDYPKIAAPTVVVTGDADTTVSPSLHAEAFAAAVPGALLDIMQGVGHVPHEADAGRVIAAIESVSSRAMAAETAGDRAR